MRLSSLLNHLREVTSLHFQLSDGTAIPAHFHITEAGLTTKHFIDCGGTIRLEKAVSMQLWVANDTEHRLSALKLSGILKKAEPLFQGEDLEIEIEYQTDTIGRFDLDYSEGVFRLMPKYTNCLASDHCGIAPEQMPELKPAFEIAQTQAACCTPGSGCC